MIGHDTGWAGRSPEEGDRVSVAASWTPDDYPNRASSLNAWAAGCVMRTSWRAGGAYNPLRHLVG